MYLIIALLQTYPPVSNSYKLMGTDEEYYHAQQKLKELIAEKDSQYDIHVVRFPFISLI